jgi:hypothetical protein
MSIAALIRRYERRRRFWRGVRVGGPDDCWTWLGSTDASGIGLSRGRPAHERAWELSGHRLPPGGTLEHTCGNERCVNPRHLRVRGNSR